MLLQLESQSYCKLENQYPIFVYPLFLCIHFFYGNSTYLLRIKKFDKRHPCKNLTVLLIRRRNILYASIMLNNISCNPYSNTTIYAFAVLSILYMFLIAVISSILLFCCQNEYTLYTAMKKR
jgi:hypothetical protein